MYSVFNWDTGDYDYFQGSGEKYGQVLRNRGGAGGGRSVQLEAVLPVLPDRAVFVGSGPEARGRIAVTQREARHATVLSGKARVQPSSQSIYNGYGAAGESPLKTHPWLTMGAVLGGTYLFYKVLVQVARRM